MLLDHFKDMLHEGQSLGATWIMHSDGLTIETTCEDGPASKGIVFDVTAANPGATATIVIGKPLGSIQRFHMVGSRCREPLPADWAGVTQVSLVNSAPMGCMVDDADRNVLSFAYSFAQDEITMRYGVDEEHVLFVVMLQIQRVPGHSDCYSWMTDCRWMRRCGSWSNGWPMVPHLYPWRTRRWNRFFFHLVCVPAERRRRDLGT